MATDIMIDLETLGRAPGCVILTVGAVGFHREVNQIQTQSYYRRASIASSMEHGFTIDPETLQWWMEQDDKARQELFNKPVYDIIDVVYGFADWAREHSNPETVRVWGNGSDFDLSILNAAFDRIGAIWPFKFWNHRCFRTFKAEATSSQKDIMKKVPRQNAHNALDDAKYQALCLLSAFNGEVAEDRTLV